jgi:uncharacterized membrane protein YgcG
MSSKRVGWFAHRAILFFLVSACIFVAFATRAADGVGEITRLRGEAQLFRLDRAESVSIGTSLIVGDRLTTGAGARAQITFSDGSIVHLGENTTLTVDRYAANPTTGSRQVLLSVAAGLVDAVATKSGNGSFNYAIRSSDGVSAVRGTHWSLQVQSDQTTFFVHEGSVGVESSRGNRVVVGKGQSVTISRERGMGANVSAPPATLEKLLEDTAVPEDAVTPAVTPEKEAPKTRRSTPGGSNSGRNGGGNNSGGGGDGGGGGGGGTGTG